MDVLILSLLQRSWIYDLQAEKFLLQAICHPSFFLWGGGGPNWRRDHALWCLEQEAEWTTVGSKAKSKKSFVEVVRSSPPVLSKACPSVHQKPVFLRLHYPHDYQKNFVKSPQSFLKDSRSTSWIPGASWPWTRLFFAGCRKNRL